VCVCVCVVCVCVCCVLLLCNSIKGKDTNVEEYTNAIQNPGGEGESQYVFLLHIYNVCKFYFIIVFTFI